MRSSPFIVAELSANHLGSLERALALVDEAARAGADGVKLQTWSRMVLDPEYVVADGPWAGRKLGALYAEAKTPWDWHRPLFDRARALGMVGFSSVFDSEALAFLQLLDCPMYKIASFELLDTPLIRTVAGTGKPMVLSTGMATIAEVEDAVRAAVDGGCTDLTVLKCTSAYPARAADANLAVMADLAQRFDCKVGVSDHSMGLAVPVAATVLGASMIEKHFTLARVDGGPDAGFSLEPLEFAEMVNACRDAAQCIGEPTIESLPAEVAQRSLRRSLWWAESLHAGEAARSIRTARPGLGLPPKQMHSLTGRRLARPVMAGTPVLADDFI